MLQDAKFGLLLSQGCVPSSCRAALVTQGFCLSKPRCFMHLYNPVFEQLTPNSPSLRHHLAQGCLAGMWGSLLPGTRDLLSLPGSTAPQPRQLTWAGAAGRGPELEGCRRAQGWVCSVPSTCSGNFLAI